MGHPWSLFGLFLSLLQQMYVKKSMQCSAWCCDSNQRPPGHESPPVTTRPGLPPFSFISSGKLLCDIWLARSCDLRQNNDNEADNYPVTVWQVKSRQMSIKILRPLQNCLKCGQFGQIHCCHRLWKCAQSAINRPIWSHWSSQKLYALYKIKAKLLNKNKFPV